MQTVQRNDLEVQTGVSMGSVIRFYVTAKSQMFDSDAEILIQSPSRTCLKSRSELSQPTPVIVRSLRQKRKPVLQGIVAMRPTRRGTFVFNPLRSLAVVGFLLIVGCCASMATAQEADTQVEITGELKQWHKITLTTTGPAAKETDDEPNPFLDYAMTVRFLHESGDYDYLVPGYFAADGNAGETSANEGDKWRAHLCPDVPGTWYYAISFLKGKGVAVGEAGDTEFVEPCNGLTGEIKIAATDKSGRDFRSAGRLQYVGRRYLQFKGSQEYFLKAGPDAPETLLAYADFDGTVARKSSAPLKSWMSHESDWQQGDPTWKSDKGKGLIGAINYLADQGCNSFSFLTYNHGGDGDNVWPHAAAGDKLHFDCSKLDQWQVVFDHAQQRGLYLHFKLQETENDDDRVGTERTNRPVEASLDGGALGVERKLYLRELIARFAYELALNWNLGEENTQTFSEQIEMANYLKEMDPYDHHRVVHTYPQQHRGVYSRLVGEQSELTGASLQSSWSIAHQRTLLWIEEADKAGKPWVVAHDEQNPASQGVPPDPGFEGHDGIATQNDAPYTMHDVRQRCLWGTLTAGGAGVEYYFGYDLPENDLLCENFRSREQSWKYCRIALDFFHDNDIPFWEMQNADRLVGNEERNNLRYCFAKPAEVYVIYLPRGRKATLDLKEAQGQFRADWFNPREGGELISLDDQFTGGQEVDFGMPPEDPMEDWVLLVRAINE